MKKQPKKAGIVSLSAPITLSAEAEWREERLCKSIANLEQIGLSSMLCENLRVCDGYIAGSVEQRLGDLHGCYQNEEVDLIIATRGGRSANHLLELIDYEVIKHNPKPLIGYSDISILLNAIYAKTAQVQVHGPMMTADLEAQDPQTWKSLEATLAFKEQRFQISDFAEVWKEGSCSGTLLGGNLITLQCLLGTPFNPNWDGAVFFWEEIGEEISRLDRALTHFRNAGVLGKISGMIIGNLHNISGDSPEEAAKAENLKEILLALFADFDFPIIKTEKFGHVVDTQISLPVGGRAEITDSEVRFSFS